MKDWEKKMDWAKVYLLRQQPFFGCLLFNLRPTPSDRCPTMWTDGRSIGFNPAFVDTLSREQVAGVLSHEIWHVVCKHMLRRGSRKPFKWNIACDHVVNAAVLDSGMQLPSCAVLAIKGKNAEQVYEEMKDDKGDDGEGGTISIGEVFDATTEGPGTTDKDGNPVPGKGRSLTEAEKDELSSKVDVMVRAAANAAKQAGKLPADMERMLDHLLEPLIPWRDVLSRFVTEKAKNDFSWTRPNRRYRPLGLTMPSADGYTISKGAVACDTSGSMDLEHLRMVCSEAMGLLAAYEEEGMDDPGLDLYWFDHACHHQRVSDASEIKPMGGGGTSFRVVFEKLKELDHQPKWLVMLTDGYCDDYGPDPGFPVLWILTQQHPQEFKPAFGEIAHLMA